MSEFFSHSPQLILPTAARRPVPALPGWFLQRQQSASDAGGSCVLLGESEGENFEDLLAAWCLNLGRRSGVRAVVLDDQRDPGICAVTLDRMFADGLRPDAAIGHFSSPVARQAAQRYAAQGVPFFAPGSSTDDLAQVPGAPVFQTFARDSGQIAVLCGALRGAGRAVVLGQPANAGAALLSALRAEKPCPLAGYSSFPQVPAGQIAGNPLVLLGSKEYAAEALAALPVQAQPSAVYLSDDSLNAAAVRQQAVRLDCPVYIAALSRPRQQTCLLGFSADSIEHDAARLLGRQPGPYFLTAWMAVYLALRGLKQGCRTPGQMLQSLQGRSWQTVYGPLFFDDCGRAEGFSWELRRVA
ncbi:ABC transporter substrate-binding protein [Leisingera methylohalidivorans]|uniref:Leucine-binding protein domain-containing protein n=1 Tax=Leisingera methylohalidivorans DSM 14336 TaxID=999552 RepID=V9VZ47_9RHOB|nr:ABC transporter substrate-binding protein [Leisingera methylohalidivorans]AHD03213.1 hypothetical protein METH_16870 [Leisingera methylohalidivorans DSM 14336]